MSIKISYLHAYIITAKITVSLESSVNYIKSQGGRSVKNKGRIVPRLHGVRDASTFMGFCGTHDNQLFSPIENTPIILNKEAAFLLSFRAICYELFSKSASLRSVEIQKQTDKGQSFEIQCEIQQHLHFYREGIKRGRRDLGRWKSKYDKSYLSGNFDDFSWLGSIQGNNFTG